MRRDTVALAGTSLLGAILSVHFWNQLREDRELIAGLRQQVEQLQTARIADAAHPDAGVVALQSGTAPVSSTALPGSTAPTAPAAPVAPTAPTAPPALRDLAKASTLNEASDCDLLLTQVRRSTETATAELAAELRLAPSETQRFMELREAQAAAGLTCGGSPVSSEQAQAQMLAMLGPGRFEQMQEFTTVRTTRQNVATLNAQLTASGAQLDEEQSRLLSATILEENRRSRREATSAVPPTEPRARLAYEEENLKLTEQRYERILKAAQVFLRPAQLAQLSGNTARNALAMRESLAQMRTNVEAGRGIPSPQPVVIIREATAVR